MRSATVNHLAHLLLAGYDPKAMVGQVLADFVSARSIGTFEPRIQAGIRAHQRIDVFTDRHTAIGRARRRFPAPYRRYAGVLLDIYFDHFLARDWQSYGNGAPLPKFAQFCYRVLDSHRDMQAGRFQRAVDAMHREDWLVSYRALAGVERALRGIAKRCKRENPLATALTVLEANSGPLQSDFQEFFPQLKDFADSLLEPAPRRRNHDSGSRYEPRTLATRKTQAGALPPGREQRYTLGV